MFNYMTTDFSTVEETGEEEIEAEGLFILVTLVTLVNTSELFYSIQC